MEKCNHLVPRTERDQKCKPTDPTSRMHFWTPSGRVETMFNSMISIDFYCKFCSKRTTSFITQEDYQLNKKIIGV